MFIKKILENNNQSIFFLFFLLCIFPITFLIGNLFIKNELNIFYQTLSTVIWAIIITLVFAYMKQSTNFIYFHHQF